MNVNKDLVKRFVKPDPKKVFFTSDLHAYHKNIIDWCGRPYKDIEEMNKSLIENWNSVVPEDGIVYCLGDFCFGDNQCWKSFREQLKGEIVLIRGNHDFKINQQNNDFLEKLFSYVSWSMSLQLEGYRVWLSHFPPLCFSGSEHNSISLFGHVHTRSGKDDPQGSDFPRLQFLLPGQYDVGVDFNHYTPISWNRVRERIEYQREHKVNMLTWIK